MLQIVDIADMNYVLNIGKRVYWVRAKGRAISDDILKKRTGATAFPCTFYTLLIFRTCIKMIVCKFTLFLDMH